MVSGVGGGRVVPPWTSVDTRDRGKKFQRRDRKGPRRARRRRDPPLGPRRLSTAGDDRSAFADGVRASGDVTRRMDRPEPRRRSPA
jgi:hypothetical protein